MTQKEFLAMLEPLQPKLFGFAYRILRSEEGAKEAMQELTFRLWKKRKELNTSNNIPAYCFKIMHNICIDEIRYKKAKDQSHLRRQTPISESPQISLENQDLLANIRQAVDLLPAKQRAIIELHDFQEFSHHEIADMLDIQVNAVRVNLSRARATIVAKFRKEDIYD